MKASTGKDILSQARIDKFIETYCGAFPDPHGRKPWKTWDELREAMRKDFEEISLLAMERIAKQIIEDTVQICKEHAEDGCFDHEGAEANAVRINMNNLFP